MSQESSLEQATGYGGAISAERGWGEELPPVEFIKRPEDLTLDQVLRIHGPDGHFIIQCTDSGRENVEDSNHAAFEQWYEQAKQDGQAVVIVDKTHFRAEGMFFLHEQGYRLLGRYPKV